MRKLRSLLSFLLMICMLTGVFTSATAETTQEKYNRAVDMVAAGDYKGAADLLDSFGSYEDSTRLGMYCKAIVAAENAEYDVAFTTFSYLGDGYRDCRLQTVYYQAREQETYAETFDNGKEDYWLEARRIYLTIPMFRDSKQRAADCLDDVYQYASSLYNYGSYRSARDVFSKIIGYLDSAYRSRQSDADRLYEIGYFADAYDIYRKLDERYQTHAAEYLERYNAALALQEAGNLDEAISAFEAISTYSDASTRIKECKYQKAVLMVEANQLPDAIAIYTELDDYLDSASLAGKLTADQLYDAGKLAKAYEIYKGLDEAYQTHAADYLNKYNEAKELATNGSYDEAISIFESIGSYEDSPELVLKSKYEKADALTKEGQYDDAISLFGALGRYEDSQARVMKCKYDKALALAQSGKYEDAITLFGTLGKYEDSETVIQQITADSLFAANDLAGAYNIYKDLGRKYQTHKMDYDDLFRAAQEALANRQFDDAYKQFTALGEYPNAQKSALNCMVRKAEDLVAKEQFDEAADIYQSLKDETNRLRCYYLKGTSLAGKEEWIKAAEAFRQCLSYKNAREQHFQLASKLYEAGNLSDAFNVLEADADYKKAQDLFYRIGLAATEAGNYELSIMAYRKAGKYGNAVINAQMDSYTWGNQLYEQGEYLRSAAVFRDLGNFSTAPEKIREAGYSEARALMDKGDYASAISYFGTLENYKDSRQQLTECYYRVAKGHHDAGQYELAVNELKMKELKGYQDSDTLLQDCYYQMAVAKQNEGHYQEALDYFLLCPDYQQAAGRIQGCYYNLALEKKTEGKIEEALELFEKAASYGDAKKQIYQIGEYYMATEQYERAAATLSKVSDIENAADKISIAMAELEGEESGEVGHNSIHYMLGEAAISRGDSETALMEFTAAGDYKDAPERIRQIHFENAEKAEKEGDYTKAIEEYGLSKNLNNANEKINALYYQQGIEAFDNKEYEKAISSFVECGQYLDAEQRAVAAHYNLAETAFADGDYEEALKEYSKCTLYDGVDQRVAQIHYQMGLQAMDLQDYRTAEMEFDLANKYVDVAALLLECKKGEAASLVSEGDYSGALRLYQEIIYEPGVKAIIMDNAELSKRINAWRQGIEPGDKVQFGHNAEGRILTWIVLDKKDDALMLITADLVLSAPFRGTKRATWDSSSLRTYLNGTFYDESFSEEEKAAIIESIAWNDKNNNSDVTPGTSTKDNIYILSRTEANNYIEILSNNMVDGEWWLRTPGTYNNHLLCMVGDASGFKSVNSIEEKGVRPVLWVKRNAIYANSNKKSIKGQ